VELNITIPELFKRGLTWMLSRYHISIDRYPNYMEKVILKTWIAEHQGMFSIRDYSMEAENGDILARMTSSWVLYDIRQKKIVNVSDTLPMDEHILHERAIDDKFPSLSVPENPNYSLEFHIRKHDLDINNHVNNRVTVEWAIETTPDEISKSHILVDIEITFKGQAFYGDKIESCCQLIEDKEQVTGLHHITNMSSGESVARVHTRWRKRK
jgi:acyl-ACP thioesterase